MTRTRRFSSAWTGSLILLAMACGLTCLWLLQSGSDDIYIFVHTEPTIRELSQVILDQQRMIDNLTAHPLVVYQCPDDISKIQYPRYASDDLTDIVMDTDDECGDTSTTDALILVHTSADHFLRRARFRQAYANYSNTRPYRLKVVFLIGSVLNASLHIQLEMENREHGDTVVGGFLDTYQNLTLKAVMGFRWMTKACSGVKLIIKMDDDVFFDVAKFFTNYWQNISYKKKTMSIHCHLWHNAKVFRTGKWKVETDLFAEKNYNFPYCSGYFVVLSPDLAEQMYLRAKEVKFFWIDDVFMYGLVPAAIGGVQFFQIGHSQRLIDDSYIKYATCMKKVKKCPMWAVVTDGQKQFEAEFTSLLSKVASHPQEKVKSISFKKAIKTNNHTTWHNSSSLKT